jgi:hypothetical protein
LLSPAERSQIAALGAHGLHSKHDPRVTSRPGRAASAQKLNARLLREIDPDNSLPPAERERRLGHARKAHFLKLAMLSARARRAGGRSRRNNEAAGRRRLAASSEEARRDRDGSSSS